MPSRGAIVKRNRTLANASASRARRKKKAQRENRRKYVRTVRKENMPLAKQDAELEGGDTMPRTARELLTFAKKMEPGRRRSIPDDGQNELPATSKATRDRQRPQLDSGGASSSPISQRTTTKTTPTKDTKGGHANRNDLMSSKQPGESFAAFERRLKLGKELALQNVTATGAAENRKETSAGRKRRNRARKDKALSQKQQRRQLQRRHGGGNRDDDDDDNSSGAEHDALDDENVAVEDDRPSRLLASKAGRRADKRTRKTVVGLPTVATMPPNLTSVPKQR